MYFALTANHSVKVEESKKAEQETAPSQRFEKLWKMKVRPKVGALSLRTWKKLEIRGRIDSIETIEFLVSAMMI